MKIWARLVKLFGRRARIVVVNVEQAPPISAEKLLECFAVDPDTPLLRATLAILAGREEERKEEIMLSNLTDSQRALCAGGLKEAAEAQEEIINLVKKGNEAKKGRGAGREEDARRRMPAAGPE